MKKIYLAFTLLIVTLQLALAQVNTSAVPNWINPIEYSLNPTIDEDDITNGTIILLYDHQVQIPHEKLYTKFVTKITDNVGIQDASTISVDYDPTYQKLIFHEIYIIRDGKRINKLVAENFQVLRRETNAENNLYDGSMSAVINLSDVRANDIIEYSFSVNGFNPIHKGKFSHSFYFNNYQPLGQISVTLFSNRKLNYKSFNTSLKPNIKTQGNNYTYFWNNKNTKKVEFEENTPNWKIETETVFVSEYNSWEEVVNWGIETYTVNEKLSKALKNKINTIEKNNKTEGEKIKATLDFVQNDIRYLGLEYGIGGYKPFMPNKVFEQRFGDCKDKSLIMATMLNQMDIEAYPMLVNTNLKHTIKELLPTPKMFDHCVVKVVHEGKNNIWYDPTITNQGGTFDRVFFPNYKHGLVLKPGNTDFDEIYCSFDNKTEVFDEYILEEVGKGATLKVTTNFYDSEADNMRYFFKNNSINSISKEYINYYSNIYFNIKAIEKPKYKDAIKENKFTVYESYKIDSIWEPMEDKKGYIMAYFIPSSLNNVLYTPNKNDRQKELNLIYPISKEHNIKVRLPEQWGIDKSDDIISSTGFYYESDVKYDRRKKVLDLKYYLKTQKEFITPKEYNEYVKDVKKLNESLGYQIFIPNNGYITSSGSGIDINWNKIGSSLTTILVLTFLIVIAFVIWVVLKQKGHEKGKDYS